MTTIIRPLRLIWCILCLASLAACGGGGGGGGDGGEDAYGSGDPGTEETTGGDGSGESGSALDTMPSPFTLGDKQDVGLSEWVTSEYVTIQGINTAVPISISGETAQYQIDGEAFTSAPGTLNNGNAVRVRLSAASEPGTTRTATLTVGGLSVTFSVTTTRWDSPVKLPTAAAGDVLAPAVGMDSHGNAIVVWSQVDGSDRKVWGTRYDASSDSWDAPKLLETLSGLVIGLQLAVDPHGNAMAVWVQEEADFSRDLWYNRYSIATQSWQGAALLGMDTTGTADPPSIAMDAAGNAWVVWAQSNLTGNPSFINARRYEAASSSWKDIRLLEAVGESDVASVAMNASGDALVAWEQKQDSSRSIYAARYRAADDTWSSRELVETLDKWAYAPKALLANDGTGTVLWKYHEPAIGEFGFNVYASHRDAATGIWSAPAMLQEDATQSAFNLQATLTSSGDVIATWLETGNRIWFSRYDRAEAKWARQQLAVGASSAKSPYPTVDSEDNIMVVYAQENVYFDIYAQRFDNASGSWDEAVKLDTEDLGHASRPVVAFGGDNSAMVVWTQSDGSRYQLWSRRYAGD